MSRLILTEEEQALDLALRIQADADNERAGHIKGDITIASPATAIETSLLSPVIAAMREAKRDATCRACGREVGSEKMGLFNPGCCDEIDECIRVGTTWGGS